VSGADSEPFAGAAEAARLVQEVQNLGFDAARTIVERFVEVFAQFAAMNSGAGGPRSGSGVGGSGGGGGQWFGYWGSEESVRALRSNMQQATEAYVAILGQLNEAGLRLLDASRWWTPPGPRAEQPDLRLPDVAPGGRASAKLWLHNTTASEAVGLRPWCPVLASHTGDSLPVTAVTCSPTRIDRLEPDQSREILVTVAVGEDASPGAYHGQLLVDGLPDVVFPLRVQVLLTTDRS
jgi:hypothetical protein